MYSETRRPTATVLAGFFRAYPWDITPTTDDRPFFFQSTRLRDQFNIKIDRSLLFGSGFDTLRTLLLVSIVLVFVFILLPLVWLAPESIGRVDQALAPMAYFACLGAGFMLFEIGLMQRFVLFLGHPVYSLSVILFTLLLGGGIGSVVSHRVSKNAGTTLMFIIPAVIAAGLIYSAVLPSLFNSWIGLERPLRILISVVLLLPLGVLLGMPLPAGVRLLGASRPGLLAWAWGINGAMSVFGAAVAILIAMNWGFARVASAGAAVYVAAWMIGIFIAREARTRGASPATN